MKNTIIAVLALMVLALSVRLTQARHAARPDARAYMETMAAYYDGVYDGRKGDSYGE